MLSRLRAWLVPPEPAPVAPPEPTPTPAPADPRVDELATKLTTVARAQSKLSVRLDELSTQIDANQKILLAQFETRRNEPQRAVRPAPQPASERTNDVLDVEDVLDALDRLDDAARSVAVDHPALAEGLGAIAARLERFVAARGLVRHAPLGVIPDGRRFRVVGSEPRPDLPEGTITRIVRSAATRGDELVREGEVIINKRPISS